MATLRNPTLIFIPTPNPLTVEVRATVDVVFTAQEQKWIDCGVIYQLVAAINEQDVGGSDDVLLVFPKQRVTSSSTVVFDQIVLKEILDNEGGDDELYARFRLRVRGVPQAISSPIVIGKF